MGPGMKNMFRSGTVESMVENRISQRDARIPQWKLEIVDKPSFIDREVQEVYDRAVRMAIGLGPGKVVKFDLDPEDAYTTVRHRLLRTSERLGVEITISRKGRTIYLSPSLSGIRNGPEITPDPHNWDGSGL